MIEGNNVNLYNPLILFKGCQKWQSFFMAVVILAERLTDKEKKQIIADYVENGSYNAVAKKHNRSDTTVKRIVLENKGILEKVEQKKEQNTADVLAFMDKKKDLVCEIIEDYLEALKDPTKIDRATTVQLSTTIGTLIDKWTGGNAKVYQPDQREDDPITKSLKEEFKDGLL